MHQSVTCPKCNRNLRVAEEKLNKEGVCPGCGENIFLSGNPPTPLTSVNYEYEKLEMRLVKLGMTARMSGCFGGVLGLVGGFFLIAFGSIFLGITVFFLFVAFGIFADWFLTLLVNSLQLLIRIEKNTRSE